MQGHGAGLVAKSSGPPHLPSFVSGWKAFVALNYEFTMHNCAMVSRFLSLPVQSRHKIECTSDLVKICQQRYSVISWPIKILIFHKNPFKGLISLSLVLPREMGRDIEVVMDAQMNWF